MKYSFFLGLLCSGWGSTLGILQAAPVVPLNYNFTAVNVSGSTITSLYGINNARIIVGANLIATPTATATPEPVSLLLFAVGSAALSLLRKFRQSKVSK